MTSLTPGFIWTRFLSATGLDTPSHRVILSRCNLSKEYSEGSVLSRYSAAMGVAPFMHADRPAFYTATAKMPRALLAWKPRSFSCVTRCSQCTSNSDYPGAQDRRAPRVGFSKKGRNLVDALCRTIQLSIRRATILP